MAWSHFLQRRIPEFAGVRVRPFSESVFIPPAVSLVAERRDMFSAYDLRVSRTFVPSSSAQLGDLVEGRVDVAITATDNLFTWNKSGADLALIGQVESTTDLVLLLRSDV